LTKDTAELNWSNLAVVLFGIGFSFTSYDKPNVLIIHWQWLGQNYAWKVRLPGAKQFE
jgi:hypothetical protein